MTRPNVVDPRFPEKQQQDPNRKVPDLYFKVVDPKLQVADLKAEVGELRSGGIDPNLTLPMKGLSLQPTTGLTSCCAVVSSLGW